MRSENIQIADAIPKPRKGWNFFGFTLVELIVVITILAILATVGFLSLSGYSDDARTATVKANVRTVYSAILTESTTSGNSPRYYIDHSTGAALSGAVVYVDWSAVALTGGQFGDPGTNYSAGNPRWDRLRMNGEKFKLAFARTGEPEIRGFTPIASASYSTGELSVGAVDVFKPLTNGRKRNVPFFQVVALAPTAKTAVVTGNYVPGTGNAEGLVRDPAAVDASYALTDGTPSAASIPMDCKAIKDANPSAKDGAYRIDPDGIGGIIPFQAYCDMTTDGGGWTVFQERFDGSVDFYLGWNAYVNGFGIPGSWEHWLGLERIHTLAKSPRSLYVSMARNTGGTAYAKYSEFSIGNASTDYALTASGFSGTAWDSLTYHNGRPFSTFDSDNDTWGNNCAVVFQGAWWYSDCHISNLNGKYYGGAHASFADGMDWRGWLGYYESVTKSRMMVR